MSQRLVIGAFQLAAMVCVWGFVATAQIVEVPAPAPPAVHAAPANASQFGLVGSDCYWPTNCAA